MLTYHEKFDMMIIFGVSHKKSRVRRAKKAARKRDVALVAKKQQGAGAAKSFRSGLMHITAYMMPRGSLVRFKPLLKLFITACCFFGTRAAFLCRVASVNAT